MARATDKHELAKVGVVRDQECTAFHRNSQDLIVRDAGRQEADVDDVMARFLKPSGDSSMNVLIREDDHPAALATTVSA